MTRPDINLSVARVFGVGLRSWFARWAPGRLYTVPVEMGELDEPYAEEQLNRKVIEG